MSHNELNRKKSHVTQCPHNHWDLISSHNRRRCPKLRSTVTVLQQWNTWLFRPLLWKSLQQSKQWLEYLPIFRLLLVYLVVGRIFLRYRLASHFLHISLKRLCFHAFDLRRRNDKAVLATSVWSWHTAYPWDVDTTPLWVYLCTYIYFSIFKNRLYQQWCSINYRSWRSSISH